MNPQAQQPNSSIQFVGYHAPDPQVAVVIACSRGVLEDRMYHEPAPYRGECVAMLTCWCHKCVDKRAIGNN